MTRLNICNLQGQVYQKLIHTK